MAVSEGEHGGSNLCSPQNKYMSKLQPLPKEVTDEIRFILEGCRDGRLKHKQSVFHCGTAHCIAGWKVVLDHRKATGRKRFRHDACALRAFVGDARKDSPGIYAKEKWGLTFAEATNFFHFAAKFAGQFALLERLERGERLK